MTHPLSKVQLLKVPISQAPTIIHHQILIRIFQTQKILFQGQARMLLAPKFLTM